MGRTTRLATLVFLCVASLVLSGCLGNSAENTHNGPPRGGTLTVSLIEGQWPDLDPASDSLVSRNAPILDAVYGGLFALGPRDEIVPALAKSYRLSDGDRTLSITLRPRVRFQDGSSFDASAVAASIERDLTPSNACVCEASFSLVSSITSVGAETVVLHLSRPYAPIVHAFIGEAPNWVTSGAALRREGQHLFSELPSGAGPFQVISNVPSGTVTLRAFSGYFLPRHPYLSKLVFNAVSSDTSAAAAVESLKSQLAVGISTPSVIATAMHTAATKVVELPGETFQFAALNEQIAPFDNLKARIALAEATNPAALDDTLFAGLVQTIEEPNGPGDEFFSDHVPGYVGYKPASARRLVRRLGGLRFTIETSTDTTAAKKEVNLLASQWQAAGMKVTVKYASLAEMVSDTEAGKWQSIDSTWGGVDPSVTLPIFFSSTGIYSGTHDPVLDNELRSVADASSGAERRSAVTRVYERIAVDVDAVPLYSAPAFLVASSNVNGLPTAGLTENWEDLYL